jgi:hypothetical protein
MVFMAFFPLFLRTDAGTVTLGVRGTVLGLLYQTLLVLMGKVAA